MGGGGGETSFAHIRQSAWSPYYIETVTDVYESLVHHFEKGDHRHRKPTNNGFNAWRFCLYTNETNPVQRPDESITALKAISDNYQFVVRNEGVYYNMRRVYYCLYL